MPEHELIPVTLSANEQIRPHLLVHSGHRRTDIDPIDGEGSKFLPGLRHDEAKKFIGAAKLIRPERLSVKRQAVQPRPDLLIGG